MSTQGDATAAVMASKGFAFRAAGLVIGIISLFLPAISGAFLGIGASPSVLQVAGWIIAFPVVAAVALASPAIPALSPYTKMLDVAAGVVGLVGAIFIFAQVMQTQSQIGQLGALGGASGADVSAIASIGVGFGTFVLAIAAILMFVPLIISRRAGG